MSTSYRVTVEPIGREVECRGDQNVLDACLRAGVWLPHACTHGTCGTCKAEVVDGAVDHGDASPFALLDLEREEGKALLCCAQPRSDLVIEAEVDAEEGVTMHPVRDFRGTVVLLEDIATDTRRIRIALDGDLLFNAGQYVQLHVPGADVVRTYSMASAPSSPREIELQVRRTPGGLASDGWVFASLIAGDEVRLSGPYGRFFFREERTEPAVLVGGGTGLAPLESMVRHVLETDLDRSLTLYQGARTLDALYDVALLRALETEHPDRFTYRPCLSEAQVDGFAHGLVTDVVAADHATLSGHVGYVCGPPPMVAAALKVFMAKRLFPRDIYREDFFDSSDQGSSAVRSPLIRR